MQINSLGFLLKDYKVSDGHTPSLPEQKATPRAEKNKVTSNPVRSPVNKQTALLLSPMRCWLSQPLPPPKLPTKEAKEIDSLKAELKTERNAHALTKDGIGVGRAQLRAAKLTIERLKAEIDRLKTECRKKDSIISQLEDLKL